MENEAARTHVRRSDWGQEKAGILTDSGSRLGLQRSLTSRKEKLRRFLSGGGESGQRSERNPGGRRRSGTTKSESLADGYLRSELGPSLALLAVRQRGGAVGSGGKGDGGESERPGLTFTSA